jgi:hypothetical protein
MDPVKPTILAPYVKLIRSEHSTDRSVFTFHPTVENACLEKMTFEEVENGELVVS